MASGNDNVQRVWTVGHSTRTAEELVALLDEAGIRTVADVRAFPASRRHPQFSRDALATTLADASIRYEWLGDRLGGRRKRIVSPEESPNRAWQVEAFRNYADAMGTEEFLAGVEKLEGLAAETPTAFLCAEKPWWRCHRRLLADLLVVRGWTVVHLIDPGTTAAHGLSEWARVDNGVLTYPALV